MFSVSHVGGLWHIGKWIKEKDEGLSPSHEEMREDTRHRGMSENRVNGES